MITWFLIYLLIQFPWLGRIIQGDAIYTAAGLLAACYALMLTSFAEKWPQWGKALYFVAMAIGLAIVGHLLIERVQLWYFTPLGEPLRILTH